MTNRLFSYATNFAALATLLVCGAEAGSLGKEEAAEVCGSAEFEVATSMPAVSVKGKSNSMLGHVTITHEPDRLLLEHVEAAIPVKSLSTGMAVRDGHMRKFVFTTADGQAPDLRFEAEKSECAGRAGQEFNCQISGTLSVRGEARPLVIALKVKQAGSAEAFKAAGEAIVKLSDYGIPQPTQLGVKVSNEVKLRVEFNAKPRTRENSGAGGAR